METVEEDGRSQLPAQQGDPARVEGEGDVDCQGTEDYAME